MQNVNIMIQIIREFTRKTEERVENSDCLSRSKVRNSNLFSSSKYSERMKKEALFCLAPFSFHSIRNTEDWAEVEICHPYGK